MGRDKPPFGAPKLLKPEVHCVKLSIIRLLQVWAATLEVTRRAARPVTSRRSSNMVDSKFAGTWWRAERELEKDGNRMDYMYSGGKTEMRPSDLV